MKQFETEKTESLKSKLKRFAFNNFFPAYWGNGARITFLADDLKEIHLKLSLSWRNRNYVGTVFGGSICAATDPIYMIQLIFILGKRYIVWDKAVDVKFKKPIIKKAFANFIIDDELIQHIKETVKKEGEYSIDIPVNLVDKRNTQIYAQITKTLYIADKEFYKNKQHKKQLLKTN